MIYFGKYQKFSTKSTVFFVNQDIPEEYVERKLLWKRANG